MAESKATCSPPPSSDYAQGTGQPDFRILIPSLVIIMAVAIPLAFKPTFGQEMVQAAHGFITRYFSWMFMMVPPVCLGLLCWLSFGRHGRVKFGRPDEDPEFSYFKWVSMLFCCGVGIGLIVWGIAEPIYYLTTPPFGLTPNSSEAYEFAITVPQFHWGLSAWSIYALSAVAIAYTVFVRRASTLRLSTACQEVIGNRSDSWPGRILEILVVIGSIGGFGTSLGLAVPLVSALFANFFGLPDNFYLKIFVLSLWVLLFSASVFRGLAKGMQLLSAWNVRLALILLLFVFIAGPTLFILEMWVNSLGKLFNNFFNLSFNLEPLNYAIDPKTGLLERQTGFPQTWSVFYWCWWVALAPVTGLFLGRISRGRTIRATVWSILVWGSLGCSVSLAVLGGYSLYQQFSGAIDITALLKQHDTGGAAAMVLMSLPWAKLMVPLYVVVSMLFLATTLDAASITLASVCTKELYGHEQPARWHRLMWALVLGLFSIGILVTGGEEALKTVQTSSVAAGLPLSLALAAMAWSLVKSLNKRPMAETLPASGGRPPSGADEPAGEPD